MREKNTGLHHEIRQLDLDDPADEILARSILGMTDPAQIVAHMEALAGGGRLFAFSLSIGAVAGIARADGRVAVKRFSPQTAPSFIEACHDVKRHLFSAGFPCPEPLSVSASPLGFIERWCDEGEPVDANHPEMRATLVALLARQIALSRPFLERFVSESSDTRLWPTPHNALFDFSRPHAELDALRAQLPPPRGEEVIAHMDWAAKHFRHRDGEICAVFDWDSLKRVPEVQAVAQAALYLPVTEERDVRQEPTFEEMREVFAYWPRPLDEDQFWSAILRGISYTARCVATHEADEANGPLQRLRRVRSRLGW